MSRLSKFTNWLATWIASKSGWRGFLWGCLYIAVFMLITAPFLILANPVVLLLIIKIFPKAAYPFYLVLVALALLIGGTNLFALWLALSLKQRSWPFFLLTTTGPLAPLGVLTIFVLKNKSQAAQSAHSPSLPLAFASLRNLAREEFFQVTSAFKKGEQRLPVAFALSASPWIFFGTLFLLYQIGVLFGMSRWDPPPAILSISAIIIALIVSARSWRFLRQAIRWVIEGAGIPVLRTNELGIARLSHVVGILFVPAFMVWLYWGTAYEWFNISWSQRFAFPEIVFVTIACLSPGFILYAAVGILIRVAFWVKDGFSASEKVE